MIHLLSKDREICLNFIIRLLVFEQNCKKTPTDCIVGLLNFFAVTHVLSICTTLPAQIIVTFFTSYLKLIRVKH